MTTTTETHLINITTAFGTLKRVPVSVRMTWHGDLCLHASIVSAIFPAGDVPFETLVAMVGADEVRRQEVLIEDRANKLPDPVAA